MGFNYARELRKRLLSDRQVACWDGGASDLNKDKRHRSCRYLLELPRKRDWVESWTSQTATGSNSDTVKSPLALCYQTLKVPKETLQMTQDWIQTGFNVNRQVPGRPVLPWYLKPDINGGNGKHYPQVLRLSWAQRREVCQHTRSPTGPTSKRHRGPAEQMRAVNGHWGARSLRTASFSTPIVKAGSGWRSRVLKKKITQSTCHCGKTVNLAP